MTDDAKQAAWREYCRQLEAIGVDPYAPDLPADDPRHAQMFAIVTEYEAATTHKLALPPNWEGHDPIQPVDSLPNVAEWLAFQWRLVKGWELAGDKAKPSALEDAARTIRNAFRVLDWLGVDTRPERPRPTTDLEAAKKQIDALEQWVREKHKSGWEPTPNKADPAPAPTTKKHPKRDEVPDDYEANIRIKKYLDIHPKATIRDVAEEVGLSIGKIAQLDAWRRVMAERKAAKPAPNRSERPLTDKMLAATGKEDDPSEKVIEDEAIFRWLLEKAQPKERAELHMKTPSERATLIDMVREQYQEERAESDG
ncbi:hypothetical protein [Frigoriglobus tundricola]|uniref:Uncharacterized protein n=1 Tax=Frigoriglobus tundricola TaxID=2774151 RepID=A0A6M5YEZ3_9BACT|nr:hypothetical protein [Frigoriglobus tundricola]QJW92559.1 hypothetical protein FTUN_0055 [Frigoriglobus tundricola]